MVFSVCLSVRLSVTHLLQHLQNYMCKGNKGNQPERELAALAKRAALDTILYIEYFESKIYIGNISLYSQTHVLRSGA